MQILDFVTWISLAYLWFLLILVLLLVFQKQMQNQIVLFFCIHQIQVFQHILYKENYHICLFSAEPYKPESNISNILGNKMSLLC